MSESVLQHALKTAASMIGFAVIGTLMLAVIYQITQAPIAENEAQARLALFKQVIAASAYDNNILNTVVEIAPNALLGNKQTSIANIALKDKKPVAMILEATAPDGYSGDIKLLIAIRMDGTISGVRVLAHKETPGLGDYIDIARNQWITLFDNESLVKTKDKQWKVKKDGGQFDYIVGATITPRAVIKKVHETLLFFKAEKNTLIQNIVRLENGKAQAENLIEQPIHIKLHKQSEK